MGIEPTIDWNIIKKAYYKLAKKYHTDKGGEKGHMQKINAAYELLAKKFGKK